MKKANSVKKTVDLSAMSRQELEEYAMRKSTEVESLAMQLKFYEEQLRRSRAEKYGASSEKMRDEGYEQINFFNEAEQESYGIYPEPKEEDVIPKSSGKKQKGHKQSITKHLEREQIDYVLTGDELVCPQCGEELVEMKTEVRTEIEVIPAKMKAVDYVKHFYVCKNCDKNGITGTIIAANTPKGLFRNSLASPSLLADVIYKKYVLSLPLYRQEKEYARTGLKLDRKTLANWVINGSKTYLKPLYDYMHDLLVSGHIAHADETPLEVLHEPGREATTQSYMWLYSTGNDTDKSIVLYDYTPGRGAVFPKAFLRDYSGYLHVDGYSGYRKLIRAEDTDSQGVTLVGCWAHARRKWTDLIKGLPKGASISGTVTETALGYIRTLFRIETEAENFASQERHQYRLQQALPIIDEYFSWLKEIQSSCGGSLEKAVNYSLNQEEYLRNYLLDGNLDISNNRAENSIRPFAIGRRNWLFCNTPNGAEASAIAYSIVETAKQNNVNAFEYLKYIFATFKDLDISGVNFSNFMPWSSSLPESCRLNADKDPAA
jgi:transposase